MDSYAAAYGLPDDFTIRQIAIIQAVRRIYERGEMPTDEAVADEADCGRRSIRASFPDLRMAVTLAYQLDVLDIERAIGLMLEVEPERALRVLVRTLGRNDRLGLVRAVLAAGYSPLPDGAPPLQLQLQRLLERCIKESNLGNPECLEVDPVELAERHLRIILVGFRGARGDRLIKSRNEEVRKFLANIKREITQPAAAST